MLKIQQIRTKAKNSLYFLLKIHSEKVEIVTLPFELQITESVGNFTVFR